MVGVASESSIGGDGGPAHEMGGRLGALGRLITGCRGPWQTQSRCVAKQYRKEPKTLGSGSAAVAGSERALVSLIRIPHTHSHPVQGFRIQEEVGCWSPF